MMPTPLYEARHANVEKKSQAGSVALLQPYIAISRVRERRRAKTAVPSARYPVRVIFG